MALRSGYKGIKKLAAGLKWNKPGVLAVDNITLENKIMDIIQPSIIANTKLIKDTVGWSGKNKLPNHLVNVTGNGTVTHNADGTVTLNGTFASATTVFVLKRTDSEAKNFMKDKRIILSRGVGTSGTTFFMNKYNGATNVGTVANIQGADYSKSEPFTLDYSDFDSIAVGMYIAANATFNNLKLYPMVIDADCLDLSYEPYFGSTAFPRSEQAVWEAKVQGIINAATNAADFAAFQTAIGNL